MNVEIEKKAEELAHSCYEKVCKGGYPEQRIYDATLEACRFTERQNAAELTALREKLKVAEAERDKYKKDWLEESGDHAETTARYKFQLNRAEQAEAKAANALHLLSLSMRNEA